MPNDLIGLLMAKYLLFPLTVQLSVIGITGFMVSNQLGELWGN